MTQNYRYLFSPLRIGSMLVRNRIVFSAHLTNYAEHNLLTERHLRYYAERAKGGVGLIITEEQAVHPTDHPYEKLVQAFKPEVIPMYHRITQAVHAYDTPIIAQINHNGGQSSGRYTRLPVWAPSNVPDPLFREVPKAIEKKDIDAVVAGYALVAGYCREGEFDGVELQCSHSSLVRQFLSGHENQRTDEYGGSLINRVRLLREIIAAIRQKVGRDWVVGVRLCGDEFIEQGLQLDETIETAKILEADGQVDYINTSLGVATHNLFLIEASMHIPPGYALYIPSSIRRAVQLPVVGVGRIKDPQQAEQILAAGHADLVGIVRAQIADPEFANKSRQGRTADIRLCLSCNQECVGRVGFNRWLGCIENPGTGRERDWGVDSFTRVQKPKRVWIVGGGPGGLEAARVAARRGHQVELYERSRQLGGKVNLAIQVASRSEIGDLARNLIHAVQQSGVTVKLGQEVTPAMVQAAQPDAVVIATGSRARRPMISGIDQPFVIDYREVLLGQAKVGHHVVLLDEVGFHQSTSTAEFLADRGHDVELVTAMLYMGQGLGITLDLETWHRRARKKGIKMHPHIATLEIGDHVVKGINHYANLPFEIGGVDTVVLVVPDEPNDELYHALKGKVSELHRVGDCVAPRLAHAAVIEGHRAGRAI